MPLHFKPLFPFPKNQQQFINWEYNVEYGAYLKKNSHTLTEDFYNFILNKAKPYISSRATILDAGCGLGRITIDLANLSLGNKVVGVDIRPHSIREASAIAQDHRPHILSYPCRGNCTFRVADVLALPYPPHYFDFISAVNLLDRVSDPAKAIQELHRVLSSHGFLLLTTPYDWNEIYTPRTNQVDNCKQLLIPGEWRIVEEHDDIPFLIYVNARRQTHYRNHLVILQKLQ